MKDLEKLAPLRALDDRPDDQATQREIAIALGLSKVEARRRLRAATETGLVSVRVDGSLALPAAGCSL